MLSIIDDPELIECCHKRLFDELKATLPPSVKATPPFRHPGHPRWLADIWWNPTENYWFCFEALCEERMPRSHGHAWNRFWCAYGTEEPVQNRYVPIVVEVNFAFDADKRAAFSGFARDDAGQIFVVHTGRMGGGVPGLTQKKIRACIKRNGGSVEHVQWRGVPVESIRVGRLGDTQLSRRFGEFVRQIQICKQQCRT